MCMKHGPVWNLMKGLQEAQKFCQLPASPGVQGEDSRAPTSFRCTTWFSRLPDHAAHWVRMTPAECRLRGAAEEPEHGAGWGRARGGS